MKYIYIIFVGLFSFFSCKNSTDNDTVNSPKIKEPVDNYSFYLMVQNLDTAKVEKDIAEILELEKLPYMPTHAVSIENGWTICKLDKRLNSYMFFAIVGTLTEGSFKRDKVYGIGIHKTERAKSFYTFSSGKIYEESRGEYSTGRLESSQNFNGVVIIGNDYLLTFDKKNKLITKKQLHKNIIPIKYTEEKDEAVTMHTHLKETGDYITATDICTLLLYEKFAKWKQHIVISEDYVCMWDCQTDRLVALTKKAWDNIYKDQEKRRKN